MKAIIETKNGFVNAEWRNENYYPETFCVDQLEAQVFTEKRADVLLDLLKNNNIEVKRAIYVK